MSLINQMLRDLDERRADELARQTLQREIRPLPERRSSGPGLRLALAVGAAALLAVAGWLAYGQLALQSAPSLPAAPPPPPVAIAPQPVPVPVAASPELPTDAWLPRPAELPVEGDSLRLTTVLRAAPPEPPVAAPAAASSPAPAAAPLAVGGMGAEKSAPGKAAPRPVAAEGSAMEGSVEKSASLATPRERADAEYRRAQAAAAGGRQAEAVEALQGALRQDPTHLLARQSLVRAHIDSHRLEEAETLLRDGVELMPAQIGWVMNLARLQVERNDLPAALKTLARSAPHGARSADYQGFFGHVQHRLGQHREAAALYQSALRLAPGEGRWWLGLGLALEADGQGAEAREAFRKALATGSLTPELAAFAEHRSR